MSIHKNLRQKFAAVSQKNCNFLHFFKSMMPLLSVERI